MPSFKKTRDLLLLAHYDKLVDDEELLLLWDINTSGNPEYPYKSYEAFNLEDQDDAECKSNFRFEKQDISILGDALQIPEFFTCYQGTKCSGIEGLCIVLRRFAYPCRYCDLIPLFGRSVPELSMISQRVTNYIYELHGHRISQWNLDLLQPQYPQRYANAIAQKGAPLLNCFGFIDGTVRPICRPGKNQRFVYNGHKRVNSLKFQSVALPNGIIANLFGPVEGKKHDAGMLAESGLLDNLQLHAFSPNHQPMCIYGDPAYPLRVHLQSPFRNAVLTADMEAFNKGMSSVRVSVEWLFGDVINYFKFLDFKKNLKIRLSQVGKMYIVCAILRNALTCMYKNTTSRFFELEPPTIQEYFN